MVAIKHELDTVQQVKEEIEELREYVDRLEEHTHRRKLRLLEQVSLDFCNGTINLIVFFDTFLFQMRINLIFFFFFFFSLFFFSIPVKC